MRIRVGKSVDSDQLKVELAARGVEANIENCAIGDPARCFVVCDDKADAKIIASVVASHAPKPVVTRAALKAEAAALRVKLKDHTISSDERDRLSELFMLLSGIVKE